MRWVALILIAANLALVGWQLAGAPGRPRYGQPPPPELGRMMLLEEGRTAGSNRRDGACFTIGPFEDPARARRARERLAALGLDPRQRRTVEEDVYSYQVLLPPFESTEAAIEAGRELARKGIQEYFVITTDPELENAISLGLFHQKRFAERHLAYLESLGFEPEMRLRTRREVRYWLDYRDPAGRVTDQLIESLAVDHPLQRIERPCVR